MTYSLQKESGSSLRGAGWVIVGETKPHNDWLSKKDNCKRKELKIYSVKKFRWELKY